jgi:hypothetical protein
MDEAGCALYKIGEDRAWRINLGAQPFADWSREINKPPPAD